MAPPIPRGGLVGLEELTTAFAAKVKVWHHQTPDHYDKAQLKQAVVSSEGALRLSRAAQAAGRHRRHARLGRGRGQGRQPLRRHRRRGQDLQGHARRQGHGRLRQRRRARSSAWPPAPDGSIYAGTGPSGLIVRIAPDGNARVIYDSPETYVWSLALDAKGETIYAGTGPKGRIYQLTPDGKASVFYTTKQEHILCLALGADGTLYAGTDKDGLVYRIDAKGKGFVLFQAPQAEVRSLLVTADGVYAGTSSPGRGRPGSGSSERGLRVGRRRQSPSPGCRARRAASDAKQRPPAADVGKLARPRPPRRRTATRRPRPRRRRPAPARTRVYPHRPDGTVRELFRDKALVLSLLRQNGRLLVGTGMEGQLFEVDEATKERSEIARLDHGQIHCLCRRQDGSHRPRHRRPGQALRPAGHATPPRARSSPTCSTPRSSASGARCAGRPTRRAGTHGHAWPSAAATSPSRTTPGATGRPSRPTPQQARHRRPAARFLQYRVTLTTDEPGRHARPSAAWPCAT